VVKAVMGQGDMSLSLRSDKGAGNVTPNKYTLEEIMGVKHPTIAEMSRVEIFRGGFSRQYVSYSNGKQTKEEVSVLPGVAPSTNFPVPATLPKIVPPSQTPNPADDPTYPRPYMHQGGGYGGGGYGNGWGGYGGAWGGYRGYPGFGG
jgi:hypothetical protein